MSLVLEKENAPWPRLEGFKMGNGHPEIAEQGFRVLLGCQVSGGSSPAFIPGEKAALLRPGYGLAALLLAPPRSRWQMLLHLLPPGGPTSTAISSHGPLTRVSSGLPAAPVDTGPSISAQHFDEVLDSSLRAWGGGGHCRDRSLYD